MLICKIKKSVKSAYLIKCKLSLKKSPVLVVLNLLFDLGSPQIIRTVPTWYLS